MSDANGKPIPGFPMKVELSDGITASPGSPRIVTADFNIEDLEAELSKSLNLRTDENGTASVEYFFIEEQPSKLRVSLFGAKWVPNQWIKITPLRNMPEGSTITVGIPNP